MSDSRMQRLGMSSRMTPLVPRHVGDPGFPGGLTQAFHSVTINPIRGDKGISIEIQPHLNAGLWPVYLEELEMRYEDAPTDGRQEAPGAVPPKPKPVD